jgi:hypothetical protein
VDIHPSARKHGIADEDIEHATTNAMSIDDQEDDTRSTSAPLATLTCSRSSRSCGTTGPSWQYTR